MNLRNEVLRLTGDAPHLAGPLILPAAAPWPAGESFGGTLDHRIQRL